MRIMNAPAVNRLVLVAPRRVPREEPKVRRYRLARLRLEGEDRPRGDARYAHLKRVYD